MKHDFPSVRIVDKQLVFENGIFCNLPNEYARVSTFKIVSEFYKRLLSSPARNTIQFDQDPIGFSYFRLSSICYIGIVCPAKPMGKYNSLKKKFPKNRFSKDYISKRLESEIRLNNYQEFIPVDVIAHNLHEMRGLNAKVTDNIDALMGFDNEDNWETCFDQADEHLKKIYVASRMTKFILDNTKFYNPLFLESLELRDRYFNPHRCVSKIAKIYSNSFKKEKTQIDFSGNCFEFLRGDKEYFEILIKIFVENALKYSSIKTIGPKVKMQNKPGRLEIEIHSYGHIIPEDERKNIFLKGFRSSVNKSLVEGTGVGLYNAKKLIEKFGGDVELRTCEVNTDSEYKIGWNIFLITFNNTVTKEQTALENKGKRA